MSATKRVWIDRDPAYEDVRCRATEERSEYAKQFPHRLKATRFVTKDGRRRRDNYWGLILFRAIKTTGVETIQINEGMFFRTKEDLDRVNAIAEREWDEWLRRPPPSAEKVRRYRLAKAAARRRRSS